MNTKQPELSNFIVLLNGQIDSAEVSVFFNEFYHLLKFEFNLLTFK